MTRRVSTVVLDANDMTRAAAFWSQALGYDVASATDQWVDMVDPKKAGVDVALQPTTDKKGDINRVHLDLAASDVAAEVMRLESLGAKRADWPHYPSATPSFVVMLDTEGNEFCVVRG